MSRLGSPGLASCNNTEQIRGFLIFRESCRIVRIPIHWGPSINESSRPPPKKKSQTGCLASLSRRLREIDGDSSLTLPHPWMRHPQQTHHGEMQRWKVFYLGFCVCLGGSLCRRTTTVPDLAITCVLMMWG